MKLEKLSLFILAGLFSSTTTWANTGFQNTALQAQRMYTGNAGLAATSIGCLSCHGTAAEAGNFRQFGMDMVAAGLGGGVSATQMNAMFVAIANKDSDGDTFNNDTELRANSDPGNAGSKPGTGGPVVSITPTPTPPSSGGSGGSGGGGIGSLGSKSASGNGSMSGGCGGMSSQLRLHMNSDESPVTASVALLAIPVLVAFGLRRRK